MSASQSCVVAPVVTLHSILEILLLNTKTVGKRTLRPYSISEAHCVLRNADGSAGAVGVLTVPKALERVAKPGVFTAAFSLEVPTFGQNKGRLVPVLKGLTPVRMVAFCKLADALMRRGYSPQGFACPATFQLEGKRTQVAASRALDLCVFVQARSFRVMSLGAARAQYPWLFA